MLLSAWAVLLSVTAGSQPIISAACVGAGGNIMKQFRIFPPAGGGPDGPGDEKRQGALESSVKNVLCKLCDACRSHTDADRYAVNVVRRFWQGSRLLGRVAAEQQ